MSSTTASSVSRAGKGICPSGSAGSRLDPCRPAVSPAVGPAGLHEYVGAMHEHSAYSDGYIGTTPSDYYRSGRCFGLNFLVGSDHSDFFATPIATSDECVANVLAFIKEARRRA